MEINKSELELYKKLQQQQKLSQISNNNVSNKNSGSLVQQTQAKIINNIQNETLIPSQLKMNNLANINRSIYVRDLMNLPKNMSELFVMTQNNRHQMILENTQNLTNKLHNNLLSNETFHPHELLHQKVRDNLLQMNLKDLNLLTSKQIQDDLQTMQSTVAKKQLEQLGEQKINLSQINLLLQSGSKTALNKLILAMALATKQGITDTKPLQETMNIINASISVSGQNSMTQTIKNLILLYLPWLPLSDGVGFDLEVETKKNEDDDLDSSIKIMISTRNCGNLTAIVSLITTNAVDIAITCSDKFPKKELLKRLKNESTKHSMQSNINFEEVQSQNEEQTTKPTAKVNLSEVNTINPYLLLTCHAIIKHTLEIDNTLTIGEYSIQT